MNDQLISVPFYDETLTLVNHNGEPYVAMKPIVENLGLDWASQYVKINEKFSSAIVVSTTTGADGKQYEMVCLPLRKIPAYLYSIIPSRVKAELRDKVIRYQEECDDVLWNYWMKGFAGKPELRPAISTRDVIANHKNIDRILSRMRSEKDESVWKMLYAQLEQSCTLIGIDCISVQALNKPEPQPQLNFGE